MSTAHAYTPPQTSRVLACVCMWNVNLILFLCVMFIRFSMCLYNILPLFLIPFFHCFSRFHLPLFFLSYSSPESIHKYSVYIVALVAVTILSFIARKHAKMSFCQCGKKNKMQVVFSAFHFSLSLSFFHSPVAQKLATPNSFLSHFLVVFPSLTTLYDSTNHCSLYTHLFTTK